METSAFASEYTALKVCIEMINGLRFKLRMMGIPLDDEPCKVSCDNLAVLSNSTEIGSTLSKKHNSVAYHMTSMARRRGNRRSNLDSDRCESSGEYLHEAFIKV